jgi:hypothetical protein
MLARVLAQVDRVARLRDRPERRLGGLLRRPDERHDGAVVARVEAPVDQVHAADRADLLEDRLDHVRAAPFAEVRNALDEAHAVLRFH